MILRVCKVSKIHSGTGKVSVVFEDENNASLPLSMLTMNNEYSMPSVGDRVVTCQMENGSSKGFVLGTYYGGGTQPKANSGYRKDFTSGAHATAKGGTYKLKASTINISGSGGSLSLGANASLVGAEVTIGSAAASENENEEVEPDVYLKITDEEAELKAASGISMESEDGPVDLKATGADAELLLDTDILIKATTVSIEANEITLKCSYGEITVEDMMKRLERIEDQLGLPHTI
jgi:phage baseplate assembly protein gpV